MYVFFFFLSGNFLTSIIILLTFIRGVHVREKGGKERNNKIIIIKKKMSCAWERERESRNYVKSHQVDPTLF